MDSSGGETSGETGISGDEAGESTGGGGAGMSCFEDDECPEGTYCLGGADSFEGGVCTEGCRTDMCEGGRECDLDSRECVLPSCDGDAFCACEPKN